MKKREARYIKKKQAKKYINSLDRKHMQKWEEATEYYIWGGNPTKIQKT